MLTRIDHVMLCVPNLEEGIEAYTRIGFHVDPGGAHTGGATHNAIAFHQEDYLELLTLRDGRPAAALIPGSSDARLNPLPIFFVQHLTPLDERRRQVARARPISGALPHEQYGRRGPLDGMESHGMPPPARGIRNTGEQAILVGPDQACGVYIGFVGPA